MRGGHEGHRFGLGLKEWFFNRRTWFCFFTSCYYADRILLFTLTTIITSPKQLKNLGVKKHCNTVLFPLSEA